MARIVLKQSNVIPCKPGVISASTGYRQGTRPPSGGTLIFSYIRRLWSFFWVQNFEFQYFLCFQKNKHLFGYEDFDDIFCRSSQNWTIFRGHFYAF